MDIPEQAIKYPQKNPIKVAAYILALASINVTYNTSFFVKPIALKIPI